MSATTLPGTHGISIVAPCGGAAVSVHAPGESLARHEHPASYVCIVLCGAFVESASRHWADRRAGDVVYHPAGEQHADHFGPTGARCLNLNVNVEHSSVRRASVDFRAAADTLAAQAVLGAAGDPLTAESALAEILCELVDPPRAGRRAAASKIRNSLSRVLEALDDQPERPWTLEELAHIAGRHPTHLARAFRAVAGVTIGEYRRRRRLMALSVGLRCTSAPLGDLAVAHGYADQAHMTREFRRFAGCSPGRWRRQFR